MQIRALFFVLVSLFFFDFVYARKREHSTLDSKRAGRRNPTSTTDPDVLTSRQYHAPRALLDVCVYLDVDVLAGLNLLGIPLDAALGTDICLCLSALPVLLKTNIHLGALVSAFGTDIVTTELNAIINALPGSKSCTYPPNSKPVCSASNPCAFTCSSPLIPSGNKCICPLPYSTCNGVCGTFPRGCGSAVPRALTQ